MTSRELIHKAGTRLSQVLEDLRKEPHKPTPPEASWHLSEILAILDHAKLELESEREAEAERIRKLIIGEYQYWRDSEQFDFEDEPDSHANMVAMSAMGGAGAAASILAAYLRMTPAKPIHHDKPEPNMEEVS